MTYSVKKDLKYFNKNFTSQHFSAQLSTNVEEAFLFYLVVNDKIVTFYIKLKKCLRSDSKSFLMKNFKLKKK